jgi:anti-sigma B factor antagonist
MADWSLTHTRSAGGSTISVSGEMDVATAPHVTAVAEPLLVPGDRLELDVAGVTFVDSQGLHMLLTLRRDAEQSGTEFVLARPPIGLRRLLQSAGLGEAFTIVEGDAVAD